MASASSIVSRFLARRGFAIVRIPPPGNVFREVADLVRQLGVSHVLDVGAHHGEFARGLRERAGFGGRIISFEPSSENYAALIGRAERDLPDVAREDGAVDDGAGQLDLGQLPARGTRIGGDRVEIGRAHV